MLLTIIPPTALNTYPNLVIRIGNETVTPTIPDPFLETTGLGIPAITNPEYELLTVTLADHPIKSADAALLSFYLSSNATFTLRNEAYPVLLSAASIYARTPYGSPIEYTEHAVEQSYFTCPVRLSRVGAFAARLGRGSTSYWYRMGFVISELLAS